MRAPGPLGTVLAANAVSVSGNALTLIGVPWFALQTTGSPGKAGLVAFCATLPVVVSALAGGPVIDRIGRRRVSIGSDLVCALALAAIPLLHHAGRLEFWMLCVLMGVTGLFHAPGETARHVLVPDLAERAGTTLTRAASLFDAVSRGARMTGAALAGVLIALIGAETVLLLDAATFGLSALLVFGGVRGVKAAEPRRGAPVSMARYRAELREGYSFVLGSRLLLGITLMVMFTNGLNQGWSAVLLPVHAQRNLGGATAIGLVTAVFGGCALLGALLYAAVGHRWRRRTVFTTAFLVGGAPPYVVAALTDGVLPLVAMAAVAGLGVGTLNPILTTVMYERVPDALRSRVAGVTTAGVLMTTPLGGVGAGHLVERVGLVPTLLAIGGVYFVATLTPALFPSWRDMDAPPEVSSPGRPSPAAGRAATTPRP
ncbi:MFS transporter [Streptomyces sp. WAC05374]|uniref:MFS transporter n=1 Tax=Streptomyces sp. WAC05374 TaxID=2487420 RepID=UPI000F87242F|nr:MFS transporter [Streptomyces sp. WAC05374]RST11859.1 MFS transporter [Streptomyces sp. WAC05374]TDF44369.1 MFS transporter [Streptomyces sp. WAC05374]TDF53701.1 MFS transporter [Streptomyces sp. WAC05374]TDF58534.1 MFS transporter [Streptomyces sp. WAC05374]